MNLRFCLTVIILFHLLPATSFSSDRITVRPVFDTTHARLRAGLPQRTVKRPKIGLVFSGGGARGIAQVGVLKSLIRNQIPIDFISATSMGSVIGGLYASGWSPAEIESLTIATNWEEATSLSDAMRRTELFVDQRLAGERSFLTIRFDGFDPVIPASISSGQRLTTLLHSLTLQSVYHPSPSFDDLRIPFRAVSTDLVSGRRVVLDRGSLAEALRASLTVPLLFTPIERDSMQLVDGGLVDNIPVDVAEEEGCDLTIVVNSTSGLRSQKEMKAPWEVADQIMGIMMQRVKDEMLSRADVVITPELHGRLSTDFRQIDSLIVWGERQADAAVPAIRRLIEARRNAFAEVSGLRPGLTFANPAIQFEGADPPDSLRMHILEEAIRRPVSLQDVQEHVNLLFELGDYSDVRAEIEGDSARPVIRFRLTEEPVVTKVEVRGYSVLRGDTLIQQLRPVVNRPLNLARVEEATEEILRLYRKRGYSLARFDSTEFNPATGLLRLTIQEGVISAIRIEGGKRTSDSYIRSEFPLREGELFDVAKAEQGLTNISSSGIFEYVYLEVSYQNRKPILTIRLGERPAQLVRLGVRVDNERQFQGSLDIRDENFRGSATELGFTFLGGTRNLEASIDYRARRPFGIPLTFGAGVFARYWDSFAYRDALPPGPNRWEREQSGEYRERHYGAVISAGTQIERLGTMSADLRYEQASVRNLSLAPVSEEDDKLFIVKVGTVIDTKNRSHFSTEGIGLLFSYEFAFPAFGGTTRYTSVSVSYESFSTIGGRFTFHPQFILGFADKTMPLSQQFRMGGRRSFFGLREDDRRGRQIVLAKAEFRYFLPVRILFDTYLHLRYDLGALEAVAEDLKPKSFLHGIGAEIALDTPIGPAAVGIGKSFYFGRDLPENPIQQGPFLFYFSLGYQL